MTYGKRYTLTDGSDILTIAEQQGIEVTIWNADQLLMGTATYVDIECLSRDDIKTLDHLLKQQRLNQ